jgi:hypothetical protein
MKALTILALLLASLVPALPASAASICSGSGDVYNHQSSLSSTSAGTQTCQNVVTFPGNRG